MTTNKVGNSDPSSSSASNKKPDFDLNQKGRKVESSSSHPRIDPFKRPPGYITLQELRAAAAWKPREDSSNSQSS